MDIIELLLGVAVVWSVGMLIPTPFMFMINGINWWTVFLGGPVVWIVWAIEEIPMLFRGRQAQK